MNTPANTPTLYPYLTQPPYATQVPYLTQPPYATQIVGTCGPVTCTPLAASTTPQVSATSNVGATQTAIARQTVDAGATQTAIARQTADAGATQTAIAIRTAVVKGPLLIANVDDEMGGHIQTRSHAPVIGARVQLSIQATDDRGTHYNVDVLSTTSDSSGQYRFKYHRQGISNAASAMLEQYVQASLVQLPVGTNLTYVGYSIKLIASSLPTNAENVQMVINDAAFQSEGNLQANLNLTVNAPQYSNLAAVDYLLQTKDTGNMPDPSIVHNPQTGGTETNPWLLISICLLVLSTVGLVYKIRTH